MFNVRKGVYSQADAGAGAGNEPEAEDSVTEDTAAERNTGDDAGKKKVVQTQTVPISRLNEVIAERNKARDSLNALETRIQNIERDRLKAANDYEALYNTTAAENADLKAKAAKVDEVESTLTLLLESQLAQLSETGKALVPTELPVVKQLEWIAKNKTALSKPPAFDLGAGKRGTGQGKSTTVKLTPLQLETARAWGMTPEEYAKFNDVPTEGESE